MDLWSVNVKNASGSPLLIRKSLNEKPGCRNSGKMMYEIRISKGHGVSTSGFNSSSLVVRAMGRKNPGNNSSSSSSGNGDRSTPEGDGLRDNTFDSSRSHNSSSKNFHNMNSDWREFRANLFAHEQAEKAKSDAHDVSGSTQETRPLGSKWAHPIPVPESGCVLVATEMLDGIRTFERSVILLLRSGTRHPQEGPFGVIINRPLNKKIKHMKPTNIDLATTFSDCSLHFGGPLEASMFLLKSGGKSKLPGFEEVVSGLSFGARNSLDEAAALVKKGLLAPEDFKFFVGYAGWQKDQLQEEIESNYWHVAACSSNLLFGTSLDSPSEGLWKEILQLMGGHYSELSRKPKQDL